MCLWMQNVQHHRPHNNTGHDSTYKIKGADNLYAEKMKSFCTTEATVNPLYNSTHYNSKILYNHISISMEWLNFSKYVFFITANSV